MPARTRHDTFRDTVFDLWSRRQLDKLHRYLFGTMLYNPYSDPSYGSGGFHNDLDGLQGGDGGKHPAGEYYHYQDDRLIIGSDAYKDTYLYMYSDTASAYLCLNAAGGANTVYAYGAHMRLGTQSDAEVRVLTNGSWRWLFHGSTGSYALLPSGQYNLGSAANELGNVYLGSDKRVYWGDGQQFSAYYDTSSGHLIIG